MQVCPSLFVAMWVSYYKQLHSLRLLVSSSFCCHHESKWYLFLIFNSFAIQTKQFLCYKKVPFYEIDLFVIVVYLDGLETGERKINPVIAGTDEIR